MEHYYPVIAGDDYIDGDARPFDSLDPATGDIVAVVDETTSAAVDAAVLDAQRAGIKWRSVRPLERGRVLTRIAEKIREQAEELARLETLDNGQPISQSRNDVEVAARYFEYYGGWADKVYGQTIPLGERYHSYTRHEPFGVVAMILPWNAPLQQAARGLAPALAMGNTAVVKPAEITSVTTVLLAKIAIEAGLPPGALNVVPGRGRHVGGPLVGHPAVSKIAFTGSFETGSALMRLAADRVLPIGLELGGKSPNIVFSDADLERVAASSWTAFTLKGGQVCSAGTRLLVHRSVHDEIVALLVDRAGRATVGPGLEDPDLGPLASAQQLETVTQYLDIGVAEGATLAYGGRRLDDGALGKGHFVEPTIFVDVKSHMTIAQEEIFGPVLSVIPFDTEEEAVQIANDTPFGLAAGIWTRDISRAHRVAAELESGQVFVNEYFAGGIETPFGGFKTSGFGREKGFEALLHYSETKTVTVRL